MLINIEIKCSFTKIASASGGRNLLEGLCTYIVALDPIGDFRYSDPVADP